MKGGIDENVTVMSPEELDIKDEDMKKMETEVVTLDVSVQFASRTNDPSRGVITFALSEVPVDTAEDQLRGYVINGIHDALIKEEFIKFKENTGNIALIASDDISKVTIEEIKVKKGE